MSTKTLSIRYIAFKGEVYLRREDVVAYIQELASGEETDVRNRIMEAVVNLVTAQKGPDVEG